MSQTSFLKNKVLYSPLAAQSALRPNHAKRSRNTHASLMLTSLVDAFSILVIFLMMNSATEQSDFTADSVKLPKASEAQATYKTAVVKLVKGRIIVNEKAISVAQLGAILDQIHQELKSSNSPTAESLVIVADQDVEFSTLNPIIVAGSRVGFSEFKFAVERIEK